MQYDNLPGFTPIIKDRQLGASLQDTRTRERILILGTASDGPVGVPVRVVRSEETKKLYGDLNGDKKDATLLSALEQAIVAGSGDIRTMRVGGEYASAVIEKDGGEEPDFDALIIQGQYPGEKYNDVKVEVVGDVITITSLSDVEFEYDISEYASFGELMLAINSDNNSVSADLDSDISAQDSIGSLVALGEEALTGGDDGITSSQATLKTLMGNAYKLVEDYEVDIIVPAGLYVTQDPSGGMSDDAAQELAEHCYFASSRVSQRHGVIAVKPLDNPSLANVVGLYEDLTHDNNTNIFLHPEEVAEDGQAIDIGKYISIVVAQPIQGYESKDGAAPYAGLITTLAPESATTNKVVPGVTNLAYVFSAAQLNDITGNRYVTFRARPGRRIVVTDGVTAAKANSYYSRLSTTRIVSAAVDSVRTVVEPYIGEAGTMQHFNSMNTAIRAALDAMEDANALIDYGFSIEATPRDLARGEVTIVLDLVPAHEMRQIRAIVIVRSSL